VTLRDDLAILQQTIAKSGDRENQSSATSKRHICETIPEVSSNETLAIYRVPKRVQLKMYILVTRPNRREAVTNLLLTVYFPSRNLWLHSSRWETAATEGIDKDTEGRC
jgi:hypothetical protein